MSNTNDSWRTNSYQFTTEDKDDPRIAVLKEKVAFVNKLARQEYRNGYTSEPTLYRVRLMPRGARVQPSLADYGRRTAYQSYLPIRHGSRFDVYIHRDTTGEYELKREKETGLTPGQLRRLDNEISDMHMRNYEMRMRLLDAGIHDHHGKYMSRDKAIEALMEMGVSAEMAERIA